MKLLLCFMKICVHLFIAVSKKQVSSIFELIRRIMRYYNCSFKFPFRGYIMQNHGTVYLTLKIKSHGSILHIGPWILGQVGHLSLREILLSMFFQGQNYIIFHMYILTSNKFWNSLRPFLIYLVRALYVIYIGMFTCIVGKIYKSFVDVTTH